MAKRIVSWERKRKRLGYFFILPFIIGAVFFLLIPLITSLRYSFSNLTVNSTGTGYDLAFVGIQNYYQLLAVDPTYRQVLLEAIWNMIINVPIAVVFSFFIASILNQKFRGRGLVRGIFFLPVLLSSGIYLRLASVDQMTNMMQQGASSSGGDGSMATAFVNMLNSLNFDISLINFLVSAVDRISTIVAMSAIPIIIFLAAFQSISPSIFEASYIEGATGWEVFWKISFPMVSSQILVCVVYTIIDSFTSSSNVMINLVHQTSFTSFNFGLGSAMVWIYMVIIFASIGLIFAILNKHIFYYD